MRILGIDPGLKTTGYGFIDCNGSNITLIETGILKPKQRDLIQHRIHKIYTLLDEMIGQYRPDVLVLEKLYAHSHHPTTASIMGHLRGVICLLCAQRNIKLAEQSVKRIRKALVGNGNATKLQTQRVVAHVLRIDAQKLTLDASDALALALGYQHLNRHRL